MGYVDPHPFPAQTADRGYRDEKAAELYRESGAATLPKIHDRLMRALDAQAAKIEEYSNTKYSRDHAELIRVTTQAVQVVHDQLDLWHWLLFPNQRPEGQ